MTKETYADDTKSEFRAGSLTSSAYLGIDCVLL